MMEQDDTNKNIWTININTSGIILEIDPNGGTYEGSNDIITVSKKASGEYYEYGDNYSLSDTIVPPIGCTISFNSNSGTSVDSITTRKTFTGWTLSGEGTLFGNVNTGYTYKFGNGSGNLKANYKTINNTITLPETSKTGYTFKGWYKNNVNDEANKVGNAGDSYYIKLKIHQLHYMLMESKMK